MNAARQGHTATLLNNGKVLVTGGNDMVFTPSRFLVPIGSAELYDPSSGTFTATGSMTTARSGHTATLLPDGKVLIAGGGGYPDDHGSMAEAEIYDPSTGTFTSTGMMTTARRWHTATLLNSGEVLIAGGTDGGFPSKGLLSAELYDPVRGTFTRTGNLNRSRWTATATLLNDGRVLIDGEDSTDNCYCGLSAAEIYAPVSGTFSPAGMGADPYQFPTTATALTTGKVLDTLEYSCDPSDTAELYDPIAETFTLAAEMSAIRGDRSATLLPDGTVLIAGGGDSAVPSPFIYSVSFESGAELYDPVAGRFSPTAHMSTSRTSHTATLLPDGTVLIAGGELCCEKTHSSAELYHPAMSVPSPVLLSLSGDGHGPGAILHAATQQVVSMATPAIPGEVIEIFCRGLADGSLIPPQVIIGGRMAEVLYFGKAPGFEWLNQINVRVPTGIASGPAMAVRLRYLSRPSNEVTLAIQ